MKANHFVFSERFAMGYRAPQDIQCGNDFLKRFDVLKDVDEVVPIGFDNLTKFTEGCVVK